VTPVLITTTRCQRNWPRRYSTYYQETVPPYRRSEPATVYRIGTLGLVIGRWTSQATDEHQALTDALGARPAAVMSSQGGLLPNYRRKPPKDAPCSADETSTTRT
jgi:hypothetical protein